MSEDIHILLQKYFSGEASQEEMDELFAWVAASEKNANEFTRAGLQWSSSQPKSNLSSVTGNPRKDSDSNGGSATAKVKLVNGWMKGLIVAGCLLLLAVIWWATRDRTMIRTLVADAESNQLQLEDGTTVHLRNGSVLTYPVHFNKSIRAVTLSGEGFFDVRGELSRPFVVTAGETDVRVMGTVFSLNTNDNRSVLIVKAGAARFGPSANSSNNQLVRAGQQASFADNLLTVTNNTDINFDAWHSRQLVFVNSSIDKVAADISKAYNVHLGVRKENEALFKTIRVNERFDNNSLEEVLVRLEKTINGTVEKTGTREYEIRVR